MHDFMKLYTGPTKFEFGRVEFASGGPDGPPISKVNVEPCLGLQSKGSRNLIPVSPLEFQRLLKGRKSSKQPFNLITTKYVTLIFDSQISYTR